MKLLCSILLAFIFSNAYAKHAIYENLVEINHCWTEQKDLPALSSLTTENYSDRDWIRLHLTLVEQTLRSRSTAHLSPFQKANRNNALDRLHEYRLQGNFPVNDQYTYRTPIFIDQYNNFCAVGYLIKATGHEYISRKIEANTNLAYVREMNYPELNAWANDYGFTTDELAWIQPQYGPLSTRTTEPLGKGTNGEVNELYVNNAGDKLYVGGSFTQVDSSINVGNISYVTESNGIYTWHDLGVGVNGAVYAIQEFDGKIFVGGSFTMAGSMSVSNIAYWDGAAWNSAGCIYGTVKDLIMYNNELYAAGDFDVCASLSEVNIAKWNGTMWGQMPFVEGHVNTMEEHHGALLLGGNFSWMNDTVNIIKWTAANGYEKYANGIKSEVMDIGVFKDSIYVVCKKTSPLDSNLILKLSGNNWSPLMNFPIENALQNSILFSDSFKLNTICAQQDTLITAGHFEIFAPMNSRENSIDIYNNTFYAGNWFVVDNAINKMILFKDELIFGGKFIGGYHGAWGWGSSYTSLNHIGKKGVSFLTSADEILNNTQRFKIYPNPTSPNTIINIENTIAAKKCIIINMQGEKVHEINQATSISQIKLPQLASGTYILEIINDKGNKAMQTFMVK